MFLLQVWINVQEYTKHWLISNICLFYSKF
jgi:hypothetical protein